MSDTTKNPRLYLLLAHTPSFPLSGRVFEFFFFCSLLHILSGRDCNEVRHWHHCPTCMPRRV